jgi:hypothetical protein
MNVSPINSFAFKANATVFDFVTDPTPEEAKTKEHLDAELAKKVPNDRKGRSFIEWVNARGLEVCYSRPYATCLVKGYRKENGELVKIDEVVKVHEGTRPYLSRDILHLIENRPIKGVDNGVIQVDLTFRKDKEQIEGPNQEIKTPTTRGLVGDYNKNDSIEFSEIKEASKRLWKPFNICYGIMSAIGIGCLAGLCWLIPLTLEMDKTKTLPQNDTIELVQKIQPQKLVKDTIKVLDKRI